MGQKPLHPIGIYLIDMKLVNMCAGAPWEQIPRKIDGVEDQASISQLYIRLLRLWRQSLDCPHCLLGYLRSRIEYDAQTRLS